MGAYVYKVTAETVTLIDGRKANVAKFAYKPYYGYSEEADKMNARMARDSACHVAERFVKTSKNYTGLVVMGDSLDTALELDEGTFTDEGFDHVLDRREEAACKEITGRSISEFADTIGGDYRPTVSSSRFDAATIATFNLWFMRRFGREVYVSPL